jgi:hypothetical protein
MVVLAAGMTTKSATLFSRQFVDMPRMRVEGLFNSFPKLLDKSSQHTFIETESVRYLFQPVESLYIVVIATKNSNMMEDLETMKLLARCVPEACGIDTPTEETVMSRVFELIFAFDEVISPHGYKENLTIAAVKTALEMDSNEERIAIALRRQKEAEAEEERKRRQKDIERQRKERESHQRGGMGGGGMGGGGMGGGMGSGGGDQSHYDTPVIQKSNPAPAPAPARRGGMKLGKKPTEDNDALMQQMMSESPSMGGARPGAKAKASAPTTGITIELKETVDIDLNKDGGLEHMEVKGELQLEVTDEESAQLKIMVDLGDNDGFQFRTHPNIDKQQYSQDAVLGLKNPERPFPISSALGVLKWRMTSKDEGALPISINCWPSQSGDLSYVNIEYELVQTKFELTDVVIAIPIPGAVDSIGVEQIDGEYKVDRRSEMLHWTLDMIDASNPNGSFEFTAPVCAGDSFFPVELSFSSATTFIDMSVAGVNHAITGAPLRNTMSTELSVGRYTIG